MNYPTAFPTFGPEERQAMYEVIDSGQLTMGLRVAQFEEEFARYVGSRYSVMVNSGSSANLLAVASLFYRKENPLRPGDEVIVPALSWSTTYFPLYQYGLRMRFADISQDTLNMDVSRVEELITPKTRMIMPVHVLGNPCKVDFLKYLCEAKDLILLEDNCESLGSDISYRHTGTFGLLGTFSFFYSHHISTMEGGMVVTNDKELYNILRSLRNHGWTRDQEVDSPLYTRGLDDFYEAYKFILPGYNLRPTELQGALGSAQLRKLPRFLNQRRVNAMLFRRLFENDPNFLTQKEYGYSSWFAFALTLKPKSKLMRAKVFAALKAADIEYRQIAGGSIQLHPVTKYFPTEEFVPNATHVHTHSFFVGNGPLDLQEHLEYLHKTLEGIRK